MIRNVRKCGYLLVAVGWAGYFPKNKVLRREYQPKIQWYNCTTFNSLIFVLLCKWETPWTHLFLFIEGDVFWCSGIVYEVEVQHTLVPHWNTKILKVYVLLPPSSKHAFGNNCWPIFMMLVSHFLPGVFKSETGWKMLLFFCLHGLWIYLSFLSLASHLPFSTSCDVFMANEL